ncbi:MAG: hypothetical protein IPM17_16900 [Verrucomicrobia bacterium]|nr:hypothetical protein [Verrucomicrobiota bacterium]
MNAASASEHIGRHLLTVFVVVLVCYVVGFWASEKWRHRRGPWEITFAVAGSNAVRVEVNQPRLGISGVRLELNVPNHALPPATNTVRFTQPADRGRVPFGQVKFMDTTVLPGSVTLDLFGNEIECLPRVLVINRQEHPWRSGETHQLEARDR